MLPIQFIVLLLIVTLPRQLTQAAGGTQALTWMPAISAPWGFVSLLLTQAALAAWVMRRARRLMRALHEPTTSASAITHRMDVILARARWLTCMITAIHLSTTAMGPEALGWFEGTAVLKYLMLPEVLFLLPAVLAWLVFWTAGYFVEAALRERSLPYQLAGQLPVHDMPGLGGFLGMQFRHNFYPLLFLFYQGFIDMLADGIAPLTSDPSGEVALAIASAIGVVPLLLALPFFLTRFWSTRPLAGALRERLEGVAALYGLRFRDIRMWRTHHMILNAAIVGWIPRARYFLMTDALLEAFSDRQLESVFAHEVGHGIHRHLHWMIAAVFSAAALATGVAGLAALLLPLSVTAGDMLSLGLSAVLSCVFIGGAIALIAPRFEHQADWFACRHMALTLRQSPRPGDPQAVPHAESPELLSAAPTAAEQVTMAQYVAGEYPGASRGDGTAAPEKLTGAALRQDSELAGTEIFISSLDSIVQASHRDRHRRGLFHPSVEARVALLRRLALDPAADASFSRSMRQLRLCILVLAAAGIGAFTAVILVENARTNPAPPSQAVSHAVMPK